MDKLGGKDKYLTDAVSDCGVGAIVCYPRLRRRQIKGDTPKSWADFWNAEMAGQAARAGPKRHRDRPHGRRRRAAGRLQDARRRRASTAFAKLDQLKANSSGGEGLAAASSASGSRDGRCSTGTRRGERQGQKNFKIVWTNNPTRSIVGDHEGHANKADAEKYLVFVNDPSNQKNLPPKIPYGVTTKAATALIDKSVLPNLATAPENIKTALYINDKFWLENLDKLNQRFNAWVAK
jgi:putative spermidine/putrescine transport system substrate-binding protein